MAKNLLAKIFGGLPLLLFFKKKKLKAKLWYSCLLVFSSSLGAGLC